MDEVGECPGCGGRFPDVVDGPVHPYLTSSPGCWAAFGEVLALDFSDPGRRAFHQVVVDAYAAQHPGDGSDRRQPQSVGLHLMTLCLFLEHGVDPALGPALHRRMVGRTVWRVLERTGPGDLTVTAGGREEAYAWGRAVWESYAPSQDVVRRWLSDCALLPWQGPVMAQEPQAGPGQRT